MRNTRNGSSDERGTVVRVIKTESEYRTALAEFEDLLASAPAPDTPESARLELLAVLLETYETNSFPVEIPDAVEAIRFRMEQQGLSSRDLIPYIGSRTRVYEVLNRKRPLTLKMIRSLSEHLGIPARALLKEPSQEVLEADSDLYPIEEMLSRNWLNVPPEADDEQISAALASFLNQPAGLAVGQALYKRTLSVRGSLGRDLQALAAWTTRIAAMAAHSPSRLLYEPGTVTPELMQEVARVSWADSGPTLAVELLASHGISVVIEPPLRGTRVDGVSFLLGRRPVVGLSLRHDRLDNFWFCLLHELAHIALHLENDQRVFLDDMDVEAAEPGEKDADQLAGEALIPQVEWKKSPASRLRSPEAVLHLARTLRIHPAIVAGRIRHDYGDYRVLGKLVGQGAVRKLFPELHWSK